MKLSEIQADPEEFLRRLRESYESHSTTLTKADIEDFVCLKKLLCGLNRPKLEPVLNWKLIGWTCTTQLLTLTNLP